MSQDAQEGSRVAATRSKFAQLRWDAPVGVLAAAFTDKEDARPERALRALLVRTHVPRHPQGDAVPPREEAEFLLQAAAEVEHQFIVQYLYAAYSLDTAAGGEAGQVAQQWQRRLIRIAVEEMGHLITVQNLLLCIGAPPHLERITDFRAPVEPLTPVLEPFSRTFIERFLVAECPSEDVLPEEVSEEVRAAVDQVGALYAMLRWLFFPSDEAAGEAGLPADGTLPPGRHLAPADFADPVILDDGINTANDWFAFGRVLVLPERPGPAASASDIAAVAEAALRQVAEQGEGAGARPEGEVDQDSHFAHLRDIFHEVLAWEKAGSSLPVLPVPTNPHTEPLPGGQPEEPGQITEAHSLLVARAFDLRYIVLLQKIAIGVFTRRSFTVDAQVVLQTITQSTVFTGEMHTGVKPLGEQLVRLPRTAANPANLDAAAPPFGLPVAPLPDSERARWENLIALFDLFQALLEEARNSGLPPGLLQALEISGGQDNGLRAFAQKVLDALPPE